jgi:hypothetical protein
MRMEKFFKCPKVIAGVRQLTRLRCSLVPGMSGCHGSQNLHLPALHSAN